MAGVRRFIFMSSIGVNGAETYLEPFTADDVRLQTSLYALSNLKAENGFDYYRKRLEWNGRDPAPLIYGRV